MENRTFPLVPGLAHRMAAGVRTGKRGELAKLDADIAEKRRVIGVHHSPLPPHGNPGDPAGHHRCQVTEAWARTASGVQGATAACLGMWGGVPHVGLRGCTAFGPKGAQMALGCAV